MGLALSQSKSDKGEHLKQNNTVNLLQMHVMEQLVNSHQNLIEEKKTMNDKKN